jgi:inosine/xanthosine triphosphatase
MVSARFRIRIYLGWIGNNVMKKVIVASTNPVKIEAAQIGFAKMFPNESFDVKSVSAPSEVSDQPMSSAETLKGAANRVRNVSKLVPDADYWIGIEGGVEDANEELEVFAWVVVKAGDGKMGKGKTGSFFLPQKIAELVRQGVELGEADDIVFGRTNSKQANGAIGILTNDALTRTTYYEPAVIMALIPFKNETLY